MANNQEKRKSQRRRVCIPIISWDVNNEERVGEGRALVSKDLSPDGMSFCSQHIYPIGGVFLVDIFLAERKTPISCKFKIMSLQKLLNKEEYVVGAFFVDLKSDDRLFIASTMEKMDLYLLLESTIKGGASDLHLTVGRAPMVRREGRILPMAAATIEKGQVESMLYPLLTSEQIKHFEENKELDFAFSPDINSRFRVNMHCQKGYVEATLRSIPTTTRNFTELGLPVEMMERFCKEKSGLILISGTTGSGKTTTMSAMVDYINKTQERVIITIEDPVEYTFHSQKGIVKQRELGTDTRSYMEALKRALRQDPDIICIGEILDGECLSAAVRAAETGHLVVSTIHAPDTVATIERLVHFFPPEHSLSMRQQISSCLIGVLFQTLLPKRRGGRVLGTEVLVNTGAVKNLIREGKSSQIVNVMQTGRAAGMYMFKDYLKELLNKGLIEEEVYTNYSKKEYSIST